MTENASAMSYDFRLFTRQVDEDPLVTAQCDPEEFAATPLDPQREALKRKVADALISFDPDLAVFSFDYDKIAERENISVDFAHLQHRHLELNGSEEDRSGIQITLYDDEAAVTVPYWHEGEGAADVFRRIWSYLEIISCETGYLIYDQQTDQVLDLSDGFDQALGCYEDAIRQMNATMRGSDIEKRPWWKFW